MEATQGRWKRRVAERLRIRYAIEVTQSTLVNVPTVIGWLRPLVLLPASAITGLSSDQLEAIIAHELAHVRRQDYLVNMFQSLMETMFFYHPAMWWLSHVIRVEREACCDDIAVHMTGDRVGYAKLLLWLEESRNRSALPTLGMSSRGGSLLGRIRRIVSPPSPATSVGPLAFAVAAMLVISLAGLLAFNAEATTAQETATTAVAPSDVATNRTFMNRSIEFEDWYRLLALAKRLAEQGEYNEAMEWMSRAPLGYPKEGTKGMVSPEWYYRCIAEICKDALQHDRLDFVESTLEQLLNPDKQSATSKKHPPAVFDVAIAMLEYHLAKGEIDKAIDYLNTHPVGSHPQLVQSSTAAASHRGHRDHVEAFSKRLKDPQVRLICLRALANYKDPDNIWRLADQIANEHDDLMAEVTMRDTAMRSYSKTFPERFVELVPFYRELISRLPDVKPVAGADWSQFGLNQASIEERKRWPDADRDRYMGNLALYAAYAKQYELAVELSADVPMLTSYNSLTMNLSDRDCHPILYAVSDLLKQGKNDEALALVGRVKNDAIALASLARIAGSTGYENEQARSIYQHRVLLLTIAYLHFADEHDE